MLPRAKIAVERRACLGCAQYIAKMPLMQNARLREHLRATPIYAYRVAHATEGIRICVSLPDLIFKVKSRLARFDSTLRLRRV